MTTSKRLPHGLRALYIKGEAFRYRVKELVEALAAGVIKYEQLELEDKVALVDYYGRNGIAKFTN